jgi:hypothetical protein
VTERSPESSADSTALVREVTRRAGHEIRNALNGVAVNVEVVRSRLARGEYAKDSLSFAERAALQVGVANALTDGLLSFVGSVLSAQAAGTIHSVTGPGARNGLELAISGSNAEHAVSAIKRFGELTGFDVEHRGDRVILSPSSEGKSHSKE